MNKERGLFGLWLSASAKATVDGCFDSIRGFFKPAPSSPKPQNPCSELATTFFQTF